MAYDQLAEAVENLQETNQELLNSVLDKFTEFKVKTLAKLRTYYGNADQVRVTDPVRGGTFYLDAADKTSPDNEGTVIVDQLARRWKRIYNGAANPLWFGAVIGADIGLAIQRAHDAGITDLAIPSGQFKWTTAVLITKYMRIYGAGYTEAPNAASGTWFELNQENFTPLTFMGSEARGSAFGRCAFWESNHPAQTAGWKPANNSYIIKVVDCLGSITFDDVYMPRANKGISCFNSGRMHFKKLRGQFYTNAIAIDKCLDVPVIDCLHAWTFYTSSDVVLQYQQENLDVILLDRCDGGFLGNLFCFAARSLIRFSGSTDGIPSKISVNNLTSDFTKHTLWFDSTSTGASVLVANMTTQGETWPSVGNGMPNGSIALLEGNNCEVQVANLHSQRYWDTAIKIKGTGNRIDLFSSWFEFCNQANNQSPIVDQADNSNVVFFGAPPRLNDNNNAQLYKTGMTSQQGMNTNRTGDATDEPRGYWGKGAAGVSVVSPNPNADFIVESKGTGSTKLMANGKIIARFDDGENNGDTVLLFRAGPGNGRVIAESSRANADIILVPKGTGVFGSEKPVRFPGYNFASLPSAVTYAGCTVRVSDKNHRLATSDGAVWRYGDGTVAS